LFTIPASKVNLWLIGRNKGTAPAFSWRKTENKKAVSSGSSFAVAFLEEIRKQESKEQYGSSFLKLTCSVRGSMGVQNTFSVHTLLLYNSLCPAMVSMAIYRILSALTSPLSLCAIPDMVSIAIPAMVSMANLFVHAIGLSGQMGCF